METYSKTVTYTEIVTKTEVGTFTRITTGYREPKQISSFIGKNRVTYISPADAPPNPAYPLEIDGELYRGWSCCSRNGETYGVYQEQIATVWKPSYNYYNYTIKNRNSVNITTYSSASNGIYTYITTRWL